MLVGGYAVNYHGYVRTTGDFDVWIAATPANARNITEAMVDFGFDPDDVEERLFTMPRQIIRMGHEPLRIEIVTTIDGVEWPECWSRAVNTMIDGVDVRFISLQDLRRNKQASGRDKDLVDLNRLPEA